MRYEYNISSVEEFAHLSQFESIKDFNNNVEMWLAEYKKEFGKGELFALKTLIRFAAKVYGVSNLSIRRLLTECAVKFAKVSESTFQRMKRKAIKIGLLTVHTTGRKDNGQSVNIYVFNKMTGGVAENMTPHKTSNLFQTNKIKKDKDNVIDVPMQDECNLSVSKEEQTPQTEKRPSNTYKRQQLEQLDGSFTNNRVPVKFRDFVRQFWDEAKMIEEFWKVIMIQTRFHTWWNIAEKVEVAIQSMRQLISQYRTGKVKNLYGVYWAIVDKMLDEAHYQDDEVADVYLNVRENEAVSNLLNFIK